MVEIADALTFVALLALSCQDLKKGEVHFLPLAWMVDFHFPEAYLLLIGTMIFYPRFKQMIGGADLIVLCLLCARYGPFCLTYIVLLSSLMASVLMVALRKRELRFIPCIFVAWLVVMTMKGE